jgi:nucleotide-binding universal stress UspA family protein
MVYGMSRLLVPIDASEQSMQALRFALALSNGQREITLLHVIPPFHSREVANRLGQKTVAEFQLDEAKEDVRRAVEEVRLANVPYSIHYEFGEPHKVIAEYANQGYQAVVMGTHGYGRMMGYLFNSVSYPTIHDVNIPVFLVPEEAQMPSSRRKIVVAVDGSEQSRQAARQAIQLFRGTPVHYLLLTVVIPPVVYDGFQHINWQDGDTLTSWGEATLRPYEEMFMAEQCSYESKVLIGDPASLIKEVAAEEKADVITLGHHGMSGLAGILMGSVTFKVIHRTKTPLLIVKS